MGKQSYNTVFNAFLRYKKACEAHEAMNDARFDGSNKILSQEKIDQKLKEVEDRFNRLDDYYEKYVYCYEPEFQRMYDQATRSYDYSKDYERKAIQMVDGLRFSEDQLEPKQSKAFVNDRLRSCKLLLGKLCGNVSRGGLFGKLSSLVNDLSADYIEFFKCYYEQQMLCSQAKGRLDAMFDDNVAAVYNSDTNAYNELEDTFAQKRNELISQTAADLIRMLPDNEEICDLYDTVPEKGIETGKIEDIMLGYLGISGTDMKNQFINANDSSCELYNIIYDKFYSQRDNLENGDVFVFPAICDPSDDRSFVFVGLEKPDSEGNTYLPDSDMIAYAAESIILREMQGYPAGAYKTTICNASGLALNFPYLSDFIRQYPKVFGERIYTTADEIKDVLRDAIRNMNEISLKKLNPDEDYVQFNRRNPNNMIPYNRIVIAGFPQYFNEQMMDDLLLLLKNGNRCGYNVVVFYDETLDRYSNTEGRYQQMEEKIAEVLHDDHAYRVYNGYTDCKHYPDYAFFFELMMLSQEEAVQLKESYARAFANVSSRYVSFASIYPDGRYFTGDSLKKISIPIGLNEYGNIQYFEVGNAVANGTSHYAVVAGPTGSGKSSFLHTLITSAILTYGPDELELYLLDFKEGTEFKIYEDYKIPHIKCIALDASQDFGKNILQELHNIMIERLELFKNAESVVTDIESYRKLGHKMPRILLVADEFQTLFSREFNKTAANEAAVIYGELISKARVAGIHIVFATQTIARLAAEDFSIPKSSFQEMHVRIGLQCQDSEEDKLFGTDKKKEIISRRSSKKGSGIYMENDIVSDPVAVQMAYLPKETQSELLSTIEQKYADIPTETVVFRGTDIPCISVEKLTEMSRKDNMLYLGTPLSLDGPVGINMFGYRKNNIIVLGDERKMMSRMMTVMLEQFAANARTLEKNIYYFNGYGMVENETILNCLSEDALRKNDVTDSAFAVIGTIKDLYQIFENRKKNMAMRVKNEEDQDKIYLVISGYQYIEPIMRLMENPSADVSEFDMDAFSTPANKSDPFAAFTSGKTNNVKPGMMLKQLLETGYMCGIQAVMTCGDYTVLRKLTGTTISSFNNKIVFKTASEEIYKYIDSNIKVSKIKDNSVVFVESGKEAVIIKPYQIGE